MDNKFWTNKNKEGQLSLDVFEKGNQVIIKSTIAGVKPENLEININNDLITIRGERKMEEKVEDKNWLYQECFWGKFSRSIVLPMEVDGEKAKVSLKRGILTIVIPKK
jgi:HSP20 family protein